jgi:transposase InsO family protein
VSRFQFVEDHRGAFGVKRLCLVLKVSRAGFYRWLSGADVRAGRQRADAELAERIGEIHRDSDGTYGVPRVTAELREAGVRVNHKRVARIMRTWGIVGLHLRKKVRTTIPDLSAAPVPDLLRRDFTAAKPNTRYVGASPTSRSGMASSCIWRRCWTCARNGWWAGPSLITCAPT